MKEEDTICIDDEVTLKVEDDGFVLDYLAEQGLSPGNTRNHVRRYLLNGNSMTRVAPIARKPEDFVDEWRALPWNEAKRWSSERLEQWHAKLKTSHDDEVAATTCNSKAQRWQVEVTLEDQSPWIDGDKLFAMVIRKDGEFYLQGIDTKRAAGCSGETPPQ